MNNMKVLAEEYKKDNEVIFIVMCEEFSDRFLLCKALNLKDGLVLYVFTSQSIGYTINNRIFT